MGYESECVPVLDSVPADTLSTYRINSSIQVSYAGQLLLTNKTVQFNIGDSLMLHARASGSGSSAGARQSNHIAGFVITKTEAPSRVFVSLSKDGQPDALNISSGELIYDPVNGKAQGYHHFTVNEHIFSDLNGRVASGNLTMYIPRLKLTDTATYYFTFMDGAGPTDVVPNSLAKSNAFQLVVHRLPPLQMRTTNQAAITTSTSFMFVFICSVFSIFFQTIRFK